MSALLAQGLVLLAAVSVVVMTPSEKKDPAFTAATPVHLPQKELEHRAALAEFQQAASKPVLMERLSSSSLMPSVLPDLPSLPSDDFYAAETMDTMADAHALLSESGIESLLGSAGAVGSASSFFGIEDTGERIVVVVNTSASVVNRARNRGVSMERIQEEMMKLVDGLGAGTLFGVVQFSQGVRVFEEFLAPATSGNKAVLREWVRENLRGNPSVRPGQEFFGHEAAFQAAFAFDPDVIYLLTDGQLNRRSGRPGNYSYPRIEYGEFVRNLGIFQRHASGRTRIHVVGFEMSRTDAENMRRLVAEYRGQIREF